MPDDDDKYRPRIEPDEKPQHDRLTSWLVGAVRGFFEICGRLMFLGIGFLVVVFSVAAIVLSDHEFRVIGFIVLPMGGWLLILATFKYEPTGRKFAVELIAEFICHLIVAVVGTMVRIFLGLFGRS